MRALGLDATEGTHYHRDAVDGLPIGNRYRTACLGQIGADCILRHTPLRAGPRRMHHARVPLSYIGPDGQHLDIELNFACGSGQTLECDDAGL